MKPNFFVLGAPKSATTSLYDVLSQHSDVYTPSFKEPHFFDIESSWNKGFQWYLKTYFGKVKDEKHIGEFTPTYLSTEQCPKRIKDLLGEDLKFIIILRDPVERAYSHYLHTKRDNLEKLDFIDAMENEADRMKEFELDNDYSSILRFAYIKQGLYYEQLIRYFDHFDREKFLIFEFQDFVNNTKARTIEILEFIGADCNERLNYDVKSNQSSEARVSFIKDLLRRKSFIKKTAKFLIPSFVVRQRFRNFVQAANNKTVKKSPLLERDQVHCYMKYFMNNIDSLEKLLSINLSSWKKC